MSIDAGSDETFISVYRFLSHESALLDDRRYLEWLALLTDDVRYRVFAQVNRDAGSARSDYVIIDEDLVSLRARVEQIATPKLTHAENPPSLARRFFSTLNVAPGSHSDELVVGTSIMIFRARPEFPEGGLYVGKRTDRLVRRAADWRLASRDVHLDHAVLQGCVSVVF